MKTLVNTRSLEDIRRGFVPPAWKSYDVALTASTTSPTKGSGYTLNARFWRDRRNCLVSIYFQFGSSMNAGSGTYSFSLPVAAHTGGVPVLGQALIDDNGTRIWTAVSFVDSGASTVQIYANEAIVTHAAPFAWAVNDRIWVTAQYPV